MTGYGAAAREEEGSAVRAEVRSVNHRFLQLKTRLPQELGFLEGELEARVRRRLARGSVVVSVAVKRAHAHAEAALNVELARRYRDRLRELARALAPDAEPDAEPGEVDMEIGVELLVSLPGVLEVPEDAHPLEREGKLVLAVVGEALAGLVAMRAGEGAALADDLRGNLAALRELRGAIVERMPEVVREHHAALKRRVGELLAGEGGRWRVSDEDLAREVALLADRMDVSEECSRLASHLDQFEAVLGGPEPAEGGVGRKLEFLVQELLREANTIGSKCNDARVTHAVVELKTHIERLREQVQNVE